MISGTLFGPRKCFWKDVFSYVREFQFAYEGDAREIFLLHELIMRLFLRWLDRQIGRKHESACSADGGVLEKVR